MTHLSAPKAENWSMSAKVLKCVNGAIFNASPIRNRTDDCSFTSMPVARDDDKTRWLHYKCVGTNWLWFALECSLLQGRMQNNSEGSWKWGAVGAVIETPKAARGWRLEKGCPLPQQTRGLGSVMSSPSLVWTEPRPQTPFKAFLNVTERLTWKRKCNTSAR